MISYINIHKDPLIVCTFITQRMFLSREWFSSLATEQVKGWNKVTWSSSEAKFLFSFSSNLELHLLVKSASLIALKHEALNTLCQNSTGTGQASCLPTCCPANTINNWGKQSGDINVLSPSIWCWQLLASSLPACPELGKWQQEVKAMKWTLPLHYSWSGFSTQNSGCSLLSWKLIVCFWGSALEAMQGPDLTECCLKRGRRSVAQMSHTTVTTWEKGKPYPYCIAETITSVRMSHQRCITFPRFH